MINSEHKLNSVRFFYCSQFSILLILSVNFLMLNGCGTSRAIPMGAQAATASFAFVSNSGSGTVSGFAVSPAGVLSPVSGSPFPSGSGSEFMAFDRVHKLLFVSNQNANTLSVFSVNTASGMLTAAPGSPFATGLTPLGVAVDPMGMFVFVGNQNGNSISAFSINGADGALTPVSGSPFTGITNPFGLTVSPSGAFLFVSSFGATSGTGNTISTFSINGMTGALTPEGSPFATSNPVGITAPIGLASDDKFLFVGDHMVESVVSFSVNASNGALTPVSPLPAPAAGCTNVACHHNPLRLAIDPMDRFIYWTNVDAGTLSSFNINNGSLNFVAEVPTGQLPFGLALDPSGNLLLVVNKMDNSISSFSVNSNTGMVSPVAGSPFAEGGNAPTDIVIVAKQ